MKRRLSPLVFGILFSFVVILARAETNTFILPPEAASSFGESAEQDTFSPLFGRKFRQFYAASEFSGVSSDVLLISGISLRLNATNRPMNVTIARLNVQAAIYAGTMSNAFRTELNTRLTNATTVLSLTNYQWQAASVREPTDFTAALTFTRPFLYSPGEGQLAFEFDIAYPPQGAAPDFDSHVTGLRGVQIFTHEGDVLRGGTTVATQFFFKPVDVRIDSVRSENNSVLIEFTNSEPELGRLENAAKVEGPYFPAAELTLTTNAPTQFTARIPVNTPTRFYRLRLNQP